MRFSFTTATAVLAQLAALTLAADSTSTSSSSSSTSTSTSSSSSSSSSSSVPPIEIKGSKFFYSNNGSQFFIRGMAYQQDTANATDSDGTVNDPLAYPENCKRDLPYLVSLRTNLLRIYAIDTSKDHSECINMFADAGIYIIADLSEPGYSINRDDPTWDLTLFDRYASVIDILAQYPSVVGFFAGNEVTNNASNTDASPFVKAAVRDSKAYIKSQGYREIPVGYSTNDDAETRQYLAEYFLCGDDDVKSDLYGINMYEWCGDSTFEKSGYEARTKEFSVFHVPLFFSEYGCNEVQPREFTDVPVLFSDEMTDVWSGGIVYMYFEEANNYGVVSIESDGSVSTMEDYNYLSSQMATVSPSGTNSDDYTPTSTAIECPASTLQYWKASTDLPPPPNADVCSCMADTLECVVDDDVDEKDYEQYFEYICGEVSCDGVSGNGTSGEYGAFSPCAAKDRLSYVMNLYYLANDKKKTACDFDGAAKIVDASSASGSCEEWISQAGESGTGTITGVSAVRATGLAKEKATETGSDDSGSTDGSDGSNGSGTSSGSDASTTGSSDESKDAAGSVDVKMWNVFSMAFFTTVFVGTAGVFFL